MKNLKLLKVPGLFTTEVNKAFDALTKEQRTDIKAKLDYCEHILTDFPQGADKERTPSGECPCGTCYKSDEQMRDAVTAFSNVIDEYGYDAVRRDCMSIVNDDSVLHLLLTVYLNLPEKKAVGKAKGAAAGKAHKRDSLAA
jgi:hypothetical protein